MPKPLSDRVPPKVADLLKQRGYKNLTELSKQSNVSRSTLTNVFCDNQNKALIIYLRLARALNVKVEDLPALLERE